ncbi:MAG TPA: ribosome silencing factor [Myxococcota bacterium]|nr:ribosome silencing factor [Myxococcota bacterium]
MTKARKVRATPHETEPHAVPDPGTSPDPSAPRDRELDREARARLVMEAALDRKAEDVIGLDVRELASFADTFVLATGTSDRHVRSIVDGIAEAWTEHGLRAIGVEGQEEGRWVLMDLGDVIVHVFLRDVRELYALERLWSDAPQIAPPDLPAPQFGRKS